MLKSWRNLAFVALVVVFAIWILWWGASGFPLEGEICETTNPKYNCDSYNVLFYSAWRLATVLNHWSALIAAAATVAIAGFTLTLWQSTEKMWDTTKLNVEALIDSDRAHLFPVIKATNLHAALWAASPVVTLGEDAMAEPRPNLDFALKNIGRSAAIIEESGWCIVQREPGRRIWEYPVGAIANPVVDGGIETDPPTFVVMEPVFRIGDARAAFSGERPLYFVGYVVFTTSMDRVYEFRWQYENTGNRWLLTHYEEHQRTEHQS